MNKVFLPIIFCLCLGSCAGNPRASLASHRSEIIQIAKREIERRHLPLPKDSEVTVKDGQAIFELERPREIYVVLFTFSHAGKRDVVYTVYIDKRSRKVDDFSDSRTEIPFRR